MKKKHVRKSAKKKDYKWMILVVAFLMIFSGFFMGTRTYEPEEATEVVPEMERYDVVPVGNQTAVVPIKKDLNEYIAIPLREEFLNAETVNNILNTSIDGLDRTTVELSNSFIMFKFYNTNASLDDIELLLNSELVDYNLLKGYKGTLVGNEVYIIGSLGLEEGDYVKAILMQKIVNNVPSGLIGFQRKKLVVGPDIPASVVGLGDIRVLAKTRTDLNLSELNGTITMVDIGYEPAVVAADMNESMIDKLDAAGVNATKVDDKIRAFPVKKAVGILEENNINYTIHEGLLSFTTNDAISVTPLLEGHNVSNVTLWREGYVSTADELLMDGRVMTLPNSENLTSLLLLNTTLGQNITVHVDTIVIFDQTVPVSVHEV